MESGGLPCRMATNKLIKWKRKTYQNMTEKVANKINAISGAIIIILLGVISVVEKSTNVTIHTDEVMQDEVTVSVGAGDYAYCVLKLS